MLSLKFYEVYIYLVHNNKHILIFVFN